MPEEPRGLRTYVRVLRRNPAFARLYASQLVSYTGDWFAFVALQALILDLTDRPVLSGLLVTTHLLPAALLSPFAGVLVDRLDRRTIMITADLVRAVLALGPLLVVDAGNLWIAFVAVAGMSAISSLFHPAVSSAMPNLVRPDDLAAANVLSSSAWGIMLAVGAALGGAVAATLGRTAAFIGDSVSFAISGVLVASIVARFRAEDPQRSGRITFVADIVETLRFARDSKRVQSLLIVKGGMGVGSGVIALISVVAVQVFDQSDAGIGVLMSARGIGVLVGPFLFGRVYGSADRSLFRAIAAAFVVFAAGYALIGLAPTLLVAALGALIAHVGGGAQWTYSSIGLQRFTPDHIRGRIFGFDYGFVTLTLSATGAIAGLLADRYNPRGVVVGFAVVTVLWAAAWTALTRRWWPEAVAPEATVS